MLDTQSNVMKKPQAGRDGKATQKLATLEVVVLPRLGSQREEVVLPEPGSGGDDVTWWKLGPQGRHFQWEPEPV